MPLHPGFRRPGDREKELAKAVTPRPAPVTFRDKFIRAGSSKFDVDRYIDSEFGDKLMKLFENYAPYDHEDESSRRG